MRANSLTASLSIVALAVGAASTAGCNRSKKNAAPVAQIETQTPAQAVNQPATVKGCLRAGDAADTFVLTASQAQDGASAATYQLVSHNVNLRDNVGHQVEVTGVVTTQQQVDTMSPATAPRNKDKATGTSGKPAVETSTQLDVRRLEVSTLNQVGDRCDTK